MKQLGVLIATLLLSFQVFAAATLRVPVVLVDDSNGTTAPVTELNAKLTQAGLPNLPLFVDISTRSNGYKMIETLDKKIKNSLIALGEDGDSLRLHGGYVPTNADLAGHETCYKGDATQVYQILSTLTDILYSEQMTMHVMAYKNEKISVEEGTELDDPDTEEYFASKSSLWKNWQGDSEDLLILSSIGDDGTDIQESLIKRCK